jgi:hypothetical protein
LPKLFELHRHHAYVASLFQEKLDGGHSAVELRETTNKRFPVGDDIEELGIGIPERFLRHFDTRQAMGT